MKYLFNIVAAEISNQNNCKFFDFDYFYKSAISSNPQSKANPSQKAKQLENAGKAWTREQEQLLIKMYNIGQIMPKINGDGANMGKFRL